MRRIKVALLAASLGVAFTLAHANSVVIHATQEASGNQHPGTAAVKGAAKVTCIATAGKDCTCYITGPGVASQVPKGGVVGTSGAGTVTLTCNGQGALSCSARVDD